MMVFGYDDAPEGHCEVLYENCQLDVESGVVGGRAGLGRGFEVCSSQTSNSEERKWTDDRSFKLDLVLDDYTIV